MLGGEQDNDLQQVLGLCNIMETVGGYEQMMNMPLPALKEVEKYLEVKEKEIAKAKNGKRGKFR